MRSGVDDDHLIELHGNCYISECPACGLSQRHDAPVTSIHTAYNKHKTNTKVFTSYNCYESIVLIAVRIYIYIVSYLSALSAKMFFSMTQ